MLAPEVWKLTPPDSRQKLIKDFQIVKKTVHRQYFTHSVVLFCPDIMQVPQIIADCLSGDSDYYHVSNVPLRELLNPQFIKLFVKNGCLTLHSVGTRLDLDNCLAINPKGHMLMSLDRETFLRSGLEGTPSEYITGKYVVNLDLKSDAFASGSKRLKRMLSLLEKLPELTFSIICAWEPAEAELCPSSIASWFSQTALEVKCCSNKFTKNVQFNVEIPEYDTDSFHELVEWAAVMRLGCSVGISNHQLSSYVPPSPSMFVGNMLIAQWSGMLTASRIHAALEKLEIWMKEQESRTWLMMSFLGMDDSITNYGENEHNYFQQGDYSTTVVLHNVHPAAALVHISSCKAPKGRKRKRHKWN